MEASENSQGSQIHPHGSHLEARSRPGRRSNSLLNSEFEIAVRRPTSRENIGRCSKLLLRAQVIP